MPIHDWTRAAPGTFPAFHTYWLGRLAETLNDGVLPGGYYAMAEQVATQMRGDILTLQRNPARPVLGTSSGAGGLAVAEVPPQIQERERPASVRRPRRRTQVHRYLAIRHVSEHQVVALIEVVSPSNKDRAGSVRDLADKVARNLESGIHVLLLDLFPPGTHDPLGMHGAVWANFDRRPVRVNPQQPLLFVSYWWNGADPEAFVQRVSVGQDLPVMPLFLLDDRYVNLPLEASYRAAFRALPDFLREELDATLP